VKHRIGLVVFSAVFALALALFSVPMPTSGDASQCTAPHPGQWRWKVKTLADPDARRVASGPKDVTFVMLMGVDKTAPQSNRPT
jgi:hypothetical protein